MTDTAQPDTAQPDTAEPETTRSAPAAGAPEPSPDVVFHADRARLLAALQPLTRVVERRNAVPILSHVHLAVGPDWLHLRGTDMDLEHTTAVPRSPLAAAPPPVAWSRALPLRTLAELLAVSGGDTVALRPDGDHRVQVATEDTELHLTSLPAEDFPRALAEDARPARFRCAAGALRRALAAVAPCMPREEIRYSLNGVYLHPQPQTGTLRCVATDNHRLARTDLHVPDGIPESWTPMILPHKAVTHLIALLGDCDPETPVRLSRTRAGQHPGRLNVDRLPGDQRLVAREIDGTFPNYTRVIPDAGNAPIEAARRALAAAVRRALVLQDSKQPYLRLSAEGARLTVETRSADDGSRLTTRCAVGYAGAPTAFGLNGRYLRRLLAQLGGPRVRLDPPAGDPSGPVRLADPDDPATLYVVMPMCL